MDAYNNRGNLYYRHGKFDQAVSDFTKVIEMDPNNADAYNDRASAYGNQGNFTQAIADYTRAIEINPNFIKAYYNRGVIYYTIKEYDKAWADVKKIEALGHVVDPELLNALKKVSGEQKL